jgi:hypothetical protein
MTWIETHDPNADTGAIREAHLRQRALYPKEYAVPTQPANSGAEGIVDEMIATVVSVTNRCRY